MKLINTNGILSYIAEGNDTEAQQAFLAKINQYRIKASGANILIFDQNNRLMTCIKSFDRTLFLCTDDSYQIAAEFGAKRFLASEARKLLNEEKIKESQAIHFSRDLAFPIEKQANDIDVKYKLLDLPGVLNEYRSDIDKLYVALAELFNRCGDFSPGKQDEYLTGGKKQDKYCRFNLANNSDKEVATTEHVFMLNENNAIVGTISATVLPGKNGSLDIYFYDEIVDYFTLLSNQEIANLNTKSQQFNTEADEKIKGALKEEIAELVEPRRSFLMAQLFAATRKCIRNVMPNLDDKIENGLVNAFIRAAPGRDPYYIELGCGKTNTANYVIHGPATAQLQLLDTHVKNWAEEQLKLLQPKPSSLSLLSPSPTGTPKNLLETPTVYRAPAP